jgi:antibiotic biosynthesis monooxygenase (ABM) superfamily enzyme
MNRRTLLKSTLAAGAGLTLARAQGRSNAKPIVLFVDMDVDPANEKAMLDHFHNKFVPEARKHPGYIDVKLLRLRSVLQGPQQPIPYRFLLVFQSEELRQKWIHSPEHMRLWPVMENMMKNQKNYPVLLYDEV